MTTKKEKFLNILRKIDTTAGKISGRRSKAYFGTPEEVDRMIRRDKKKKSKLKKLVLYITSSKKKKRKKSHRRRKR